jgi:hypothetical protein
MHEYGGICGTRIDRGNLSTRRKPGLMPLSPQQIEGGLAWDRTQADGMPAHIFRGELVFAQDAQSQRGGGGGGGGRGPPVYQALSKH